MSRQLVVGVGVHSVVSQHIICTGRFDVLFRCRQLNRRTTIALRISIGVFAVLRSSVITTKALKKRKSRRIGNITETMEFRALQYQFVFEGRGIHFRSRIHPLTPRVECKQCGQALVQMCIQHVVF